MSTHGSFATAVNCMDGRVQLPVIHWLKDTYHVDYVDMITDPGPIKILSENTDIALIESIKKRVAISTDKHGSKNLAIVGDYDCAGNPVNKETQLSQLSRSIQLVRSWNNNISVIGLWVDEDWIVHTI